MALSGAARLRLLDSRCFLEKRKRRLSEVAFFSPRLIFRFALWFSHDQILPQFGSTDTAANVLDDLHVRLQSCRRILAPPGDAAFRPDRGFEWPEHDILMLKFF